MKQSKIEDLKKKALEKAEEGKLKLENNLKTITDIIQKKEIKEKVDKAAKDISQYTNKKIDELKKNEKVKMVQKKATSYASDTIEKLKKNQNVKNISKLVNEKLDKIRKK